MEEPPFTLDQIKSQVRKVRTYTQTLYSNQNISTCKNFIFHPTQHKFYFLSNCVFLHGYTCRQLLFYQVDYSSLYSDTSDSDLRWTRVFEEYKISQQDNNGLSNDQYNHRTYTLLNVSSFQMIGENVILVHLGNIYAGKLGQIPTLVSSRFVISQKSKLVTPNLFPVTSSNSHTSGMNENITTKKPTLRNNNNNNNGNDRYDPKLGGINNDLIAFICNHDIWVTTMDGDEMQLTFCSDHHNNDSLSCGISEYIMQEEFHRYTGYYWFPSNVPSNMNRILYLETNDEDVDLIYFSEVHNHHHNHHHSNNYSSNSNNGIRNGPTNSESAKYPQAGHPNVKSQLCIVEFSNLTSKSEPTIIHKRLWGDDVIEKLYPWAEYYVRFGWLPDGKSVWVQLLSRDQQKTAVIRIAYNLFKSNEENKMISLKNQLKQSQHKIEELWHETSPAWINVSDVYYFLSTDNSNNNNNDVDDELEDINFIWSSERTGYRHLYHVSTSNHQQKHVNTNNQPNNNSNNNNNHNHNDQLSIIQLTFGDWCVVDKSIYVDQVRKLIYFIAKKDTPLEAHLYVTSYDHKKYPSYHHPIQRLTPLGYSHNVVMYLRTGVFIDSMSSLQQSQSLVLRKLIFNDDGDDTLPHVIDIDDANNSNNNNNNSNKNESNPFKKSMVTLMPFMTNVDNGHEKEFHDSFDQLIIASPTSTPIPKSGPMNQHIQNNNNNANNNNNGVNLHENHSHNDDQNSSLSQSNNTPVSNGLNFSHATHLMDNVENRLKTTITAATTPQGQIFEFLTSDGIKLYGCLYKPWMYQPGKSYPTLLHIYGGPKTQMITNEFKYPRLIRYLMAVYFGFAVVIIDGRGSSDRGLAFESHLKSRLGQVELEDQIEGLKYLSESCFGALPIKEVDDGDDDDHRKRKLISVIDLNRIAITGWSYGGYLSLLALSKYSHFFRIGIAGAPVVDWHLYDTAYTERYMGLPKDYEKEYEQSSILHWVDDFPDEENRLIIVHGLIDENVHIKNTEQLIAKLNEKGKPHKYQVYPTEKHGLRHASVNEHFEVLMFHCLLNHL